MIIQDPGFDERRIEERIAALRIHARANRLDGKARALISFDDFIAMAQRMNAKIEDAEDGTPIFVKLFTPGGVVYVEYDPDCPRGHITLEIKEPSVGEASADCAQSDDGPRCDQSAPRCDQNEPKDADPCRELVAGDVVRLKTGGPIMVVEHVGVMPVLRGRPAGLDSALALAERTAERARAEDRNAVWCTWFVNMNPGVLDRHGWSAGPWSGPYREGFDRDALELVGADPDPQLRAKVASWRAELQRLLPRAQEASLDVVARSVGVDLGRIVNEMRGYGD